MRTTRSLTVAVLLLVAAGGCGGGDAGPPLLLVGTGLGVAVLDAASGVLGPPAPTAISSPGGELLVRADLVGTRTQLRIVGVADGAEEWSSTVEGSYEPRSVAADGDRVALVPPPGPTAAGALAPGRSRTDLAVVHDDGRTERYDLEGNVEPEAFSLDGTALFVISFLPAEAPTSYQVRRLDLGTGELGDVFSVDAELQESMRGTARTQAWDPDGDRLYTLYTSHHGDDVTTFVHVLDLDEQWAHCIDLPAGLSPGTAGMALAEGGDQLYVADAVGGSVVEVDTTELMVARVGSIALRAAPGATSVATGDDEVYVGAGPEVVRLDRRSLEVVETFPSDGDVVGLQRSRTSDELFVGWVDGVGVLDPVEGTLLRRWPLDTAATGGVLSLGGRAVPGYAGIQCAC